MIAQEWQGACRAFFNAACTLYNISDNRYFAFFERCKSIAEEKGFQEILGHIEVFLGLAYYQKGDFSTAATHLSSGLKHAGTKDFSMLRLQLLSTLSLVQLAHGKFGIAKKLINQTLEMAREDKSNRFGSRYLKLRAELLWNQSQIPQSIETLQVASQQIQNKPNPTLEDFSTLNLFLYQSSILGKKNILTRDWSEKIKKNTFTWLEHLTACIELEINEQNWSLAKKLIKEVLEKSIDSGDRFHEGIARIAMVQAALGDGTDIGHIEEIIGMAAESVSKMGDSLLKPRISLLYAGLSYRMGDFSATRQYLKSANRYQRVSLVDKICIQAWISTTEGHSGKFSLPWQDAMIARQTRVYFAPKIVKAHEGIFIVSGKYEINLRQNPSLYDIISFLLNRASFSASPENIQTEVWKQSLHQKGWQQKIRNSITRLRNLFPYTIAPLILQRERIRVFAEAFQIAGGFNSPDERKQNALNFLNQEPMSSKMLSERMQISPATSKRLLKDLIANQSIISFKEGRKVLYQRL